MHLRWLFASLLAGCSSEPAAETGAADAAAETATSDTRAPANSDTALADEDASSIPTFEGDIVPLFNSSCGATNNECHSRVAYHPNPAEGCRGWLSLENASIGSTYYAGADIGKPTGCPDMPLYERLTELDSWECGAPYFPAFPKTKYIQPGDPSRSHLLNKMNGGPQCGVPNVMPKDVPPSASDIEILRRWIAAGAPR
jgi:hypothetical protein